MTVNSVMDQLAVIKSIGIIECDFDEVQKQVNEYVSKWDGVVFTEDNVPELKKDIAELNKKLKEAEDIRKNVKAKFLEPYSNFENKYKEAMAGLTDLIDNLKKQKTSFEEDRIKEKQEHIKELYEANIGEFKDILPLEKVRKPQWDNATYKDSDIVYDISEKVQHIKSDFMVIESLKSEIEAELKDTYIRSGFELSVALKKNSDYQDAKKLAEEHLRAEEERKRKEEEEKRLQEALQAQKEALKKEAEEITEEEITPADIPFAQPDKATFTVYGDDIAKVVDFLEFSEIRYERG